MIRSRLTRRQALRAAAALGSFAIVGRARAARPFTPSDSLVEAARKEGKLTLYTATFIEVEQEVVNEFRKRFPFIRVEMIRAPGGQLITRVKTEAASGKLAADLVLHSDRGLTKGIEHIFADYAPPNAADTKIPVISVPSSPPTPCTGNTSSESSTRSARFMKFVAKKQATPATPPITSAPSGPTNPDAGVIVPSPATMPVTMPSTDGLP